MVQQALMTARPISVIGESIQGLLHMIDPRDGKCLCHKGRKVAPAPFIPPSAWGRSGARWCLHCESDFRRTWLRLCESVGREWRAAQ